MNNLLKLPNHLSKNILFSSTYNFIIETVLDSIMLVASALFLVLYVVHLYRNNWSFLIQNKKRATPKLQVSRIFWFKFDFNV